MCIQYLIHLFFFFLITTIFSPPSFFSHTYDKYGHIHGKLVGKLSEPVYGNPEEREWLPIINKSNNTHNSLSEITNHRPILTESNSVKV